MPLRKVLTRLPMMMRRTAHRGAQHALGTKMRAPLALFVVLVAGVASFSPRGGPKAPLRSMATISSGIAERAPVLALADDDGCKKSTCRCSDCKACCKDGVCTAGNSCCDTRCCCADEETCGPGCPG